MVINFTLTQFVPGGPIEQIHRPDRGRRDVFEAYPAPRRRRSTPETRAMWAPVACRPISSSNSNGNSVSTSPPLERFFSMMWDYMRLDFGERLFPLDLGGRPRNREDAGLDLRWAVWSTVIAYLILQSARHPQGSEGRLVLRYLDFGAHHRSLREFPAFSSQSCCSCFFSPADPTSRSSRCGVSLPTLGATVLLREDHGLSLAHHTAGPRIDHRELCDADASDEELLSRRDQRSSTSSTAKAKGLSESRVLYGHTSATRCSSSSRASRGFSFPFSSGLRSSSSTIFSLDGLGRPGFEKLI